MEMIEENAPPPPLRNIAKKSLPLMAINTISILGEFINTYLLSNKSQNTLGASMLVMAINNFVSDSITMLPNQNAALIAEHFGELQELKKTSAITAEPEKIGFIFRQGGLIGLVASIPGMIVLFPIAPILKSLGQSADTSELVGQYFLPAAFALPLQTLLNNNERLLPSVNLERWLIPYKIVLTGLEIGLNVLLIPRYGMYGAGLALLGKNIIGLTLTTLFMLMKKDLKAFNIFSRALKLKEYPYYKKILLQGLPITLAQFGITGAGFGVSLAIGHLGNLRLQIEKVTQQYFGILTTITHGINDAAYRLVGQAAGAKNYPLMRNYGNLGLLSSSAFFSVGALAVNFAAFPLAAVFMGQNAYKNESLIRYTFILATLAKLCSVILESGTLNLAALQDTLLPSLVSLLTTVAMILPASLMLSYLSNLDIYGITATIAGGLLLAGSANALYWLKQSRTAVTQNSFDMEKDTSNVKFSQLISSIPLFKRCTKPTKKKNSENEALLHPKLNYENN